MNGLPADAPLNSGEAFARVNAVTHPTIDDFRMMVYLEASAKNSYYEMAETAPSQEIAELLQANGREELAHAHRVANVIELITGKPFVVPVPEDNQYVKRSGVKVERALLENLVKAENNGNDLYETWASHIDHAEAAVLLRQNGVEEIRHGERMSQALALLGD
jgi:rubrerythrin